MGIIFVRPDRYVSLFGEFFYDFNKWRGGVPFEEQLKALQEVIDEGKVWIYYKKPVIAGVSLRNLLSSLCFNGRNL